MTPDMAMGHDCEGRLCGDVIEHGVKIEGLDRATTRLERRLDALLYAALGSLATSTGTLLVLLLQKRS